MILNITQKGKLYRKENTLYFEQLNEYIKQPLPL